jgi:hypothetical protein
MAKEKTQNLTLKKAAMLEALEKSLGIVTSAAKSVGIRRETHYAWLNEDAEYKAQVEALSDVALDFAESQLHKQIQNGEVASTIFFLKTKGKHRGYTGDGNKVTVNDQDGKTITVEYSS